MKKDLFIIDNALDEREFRNYVSSILEKNGYKDIIIDDPRLINEGNIDDNDIIAKKRNNEYTIQTYLNTNISEKHIEETLEDMKKEKVNKGIIISNLYVTKKIVEIARDNNITVIDREYLERLMDK